ncbi:hypothetical protein KRM28CT15_40310 [Krasilnikovia sp. M28-CT-15]
MGKPWVIEDEPWLGIARVHGGGSTPLTRGTSDTPGGDVVAPAAAKRREAALYGS